MQQSPKSPKSPTTKQSSKSPATPANTKNPAKKPSMGEKINKGITSVGDALKKLMDTFSGKALAVLWAGALAGTALTNVPGTEEKVFSPKTQEVNLGQMVETALRNPPKWHMNSTETADMANALYEELRDIGESRWEQLLHCVDKNNATFTDWGKTYGINISEDWGTKKITIRKGNGDTLILTWHDNGTVSIIEDGITRTINAATLRTLLKRYKDNPATYQDPDGKWNDLSVMLYGSFGILVILKLLGAMLGSKPDHDTTTKSTHHP
jgi:hypothetical protein